MEDASYQEFSKLLKAWSAAIVTNDAEAIDRFITEDWVIIGRTGIYPRDVFLEWVDTGIVTHDMMEHDVQLAREYGDTAVVVCRARNTGTYKGEPFTNDEWTTDVFRKQNGRWLCELTHLTPAKVE